MRIRSKNIKRLGGLLLSTATRHWMSTLEFRQAAYNPTVDPVHPQFAGPAIFLFWHEYIPALFYLRGHCRISMLVSRHGDAEWLSHAARHMGFGTVHGSTNRGGVQALRELLTCGRRRMNLAITPDGPRGPRRRLAPGPIYLASKSGLPLVCVGLGYSDAWRLPTWDRFAIPKPGSRGRGVTSDYLSIPPHLDRASLEHYRKRIESLLNGLTETAESWARSGQSLEGEIRVRRNPLPWNSVMRDPPVGEAAPPLKRCA